MKYRVVVEKGDRNFSAYALDIPGAVVATGRTRDEVLQNIADAIAFHLDGLSQRELGRQPSQPAEIAEVDIART